MAELFRVVIQVGEIDAAAHFYERLLDCLGERVSPGRHYLPCGQTILACYDPVADGDDGVAPGPMPDHVYFSVANVDDAFTRARDLPCRRLDDMVQVRPWGERSVYGEDPFGNPFCLVHAPSAFIGVTTQPRVTRSATCLPVTDVAVTGRYYVNVLGFDREYEAGEPTEFGIYRLDAATVMLRRTSAPVVPATAQGGTWDMFCWVRHVDTLYARCIGRGALSQYAPVDMPYGVRECALRDPDGHVIGFGEVL